MSKELERQHKLVTLHNVTPHRSDQAEHDQEAIDNNAVSSSMQGAPLLDHPTSQGRQQQQIVHLQRTQGNTFTQQYIHGLQSNAVSHQEVASELDGTLSNDRLAEVRSSAPLLSTAQGIQRVAARAGSRTAVRQERVPGTLWAKDARGRTLPPSLEDISQGGLNDCFLFAAMAAIVSTNPQRIVDMIRQNKDGSYTVTFKGIGKQTVSAEFPVGKHGNVTKRKALWPLIIEKAYAQQGGGLRVFNNGGNPGTAVDKMIDNQPKNQPNRFDPREKSTSEIMRALAEAKQRKWPMTILAPKKEGASKEQKQMADTPGLYFWHAYAITDVDRRNNRIKLFNPWGRDHPNGDGWMDIAQVRKFFIEIDIND